MEAKVCVGFLWIPWFPPISQSCAREMNWYVCTAPVWVGVGVGMSGSAVDWSLSKSGFCFAPWAAGMVSGHLDPKLE